MTKFKEINKKQIEEEAKKRQEAEEKQADMIVGGAKKMCDVLQDKKIFNAQGLIQQTAVILQQGFMMKMSSMKVSELEVIELLRKQINPGSAMAKEQELILKLIESVQDETIGGVMQIAEWIDKKIKIVVEEQHKDDDFKKYNLFEINAK